MVTCTLSALPQAAAEGCYKLYEQVPRKLPAKSYYITRLKTYLPALVLVPGIAWGAILDGMIVATSDQSRGRTDPWSGTCLADSPRSDVNHWTQGQVPWCYSRQGPELEWSCHQDIRRKCLASLAQLKWLFPAVPRRTRILLFNTLVLPHQLHLEYLWNEIANEARKDSKLCYEVDNFRKTQDT